MKNPNRIPTLLATMMAGILAATALPALSDEHCGDLGECRVYIEINASDGDIGLHTLFDGEGWNVAKICTGAECSDVFGGSTIIFEAEVTDGTDAPLASQKLTENFFESAEPSCEEKTLAEFLSDFPVGTYYFQLDDGATQTGETELTHVIPAAPADVDFNGHDIFWEYGDDLGECDLQGFELAEKDEIIGYEVVMEPDDDELSAFTFVARVGPEVNKIRVPKAYLDSLEPNTPLKVEVGAIEDRDGFFGNQTFSEEDGFCNNPSQRRCPEEDEED